MTSVLSEGIPCNIVKWKSLERHPIGAAYEDIEGPAWDRFKSGIKKNGIVNGRSVVIYENRVLDGYQLYRACIDLGIKPNFITVPPGMDPELFVEMVNDNRRHESREAMERRVSERAARFKAALANGKSISQLAAEEGVSRKTVQNTTKKKSGSRGKKRKKNKVGGCDPSQGENAETNAENEGTSDENDSESTVDSVKDEEGHDVPDRLKYTFTNHFGTILSVCQQAQKLLDEASKSAGGEQLRRCLQATGAEGKTINKSEHLNALKRDVKGTRPHSVCPWCKGEDKPLCKGCSGHGWVTFVTWKNAEDAVKARLA